MQGLAAKASLLDIATVANKSSKGSENFIESNQNLSDDSSQGDFLSSLLSAIDETNEFLPDRLKISDKEISAEIIANIEKNSNFFGFSSENNEMSIFESLSFMEVLGVLETLKIKSTDVKLSNLSNLTQQFLQSESNFNALKGAKNLSELLDIAKGLDLNVSNIKIDRILDLKNTFPNLDKAGFFNQSLESAFKDILNTKISNIVDKIEKKDKNTNVNSNKNSKDILSQALKLTDEKVKTKDSKDKKIENLDNNDLLKLDTKNQTIKDTKVENLITDNEAIIKNTNDKTSNKLAVDEIKKEDFKEVKTNAKKDELPLKDDSQKIKENMPKINENIKTENKNETFNKIQENKEVSKDISKEKPLENKSNLQENSELKNENSKVKTQNLDTNTIKNLAKQDEKQELKLDNTDKNLALNKDEKIDDKIDNKQNINTKQDNTKQAEIKQADIENTKPSLQTTQVKSAEKVVVDTSVLKNIKQEPSTKESDIITDNKLELNTKINQNKINPNLANSNPNNNLEQQNSQSQNQNTKEIATNNNVKEHNTDTKSDVKYNTNELNNLVSTLSKISANELKANLNVRETFSYFANDLKEQMQQFKAPITKLNITLNPSNLGEVEVTLIQRGSALHINFNSNPNTMALFVQNQAEFKNSLVNMGFTGLEMNFSDQKQKDQKEQTSKNKNSYKASGDFAISEPTQSPLELILAKYF